MNPTDYTEYTFQAFEWINELYDVINGWFFVKLGELFFVKEFQIFLQSLEVSHPTVSGFIEMLGSLIVNILPIFAIGQILAIKLAVWGTNLFFAVIWRAKSLIPTMGH